MLISLLTFLLISNAVSLKRDKSILFSRVVISGAIISSVLALNNLYVKCIEDGVGIYGGLFNVTTFAQAFNIFILLVSATILILTSFYPRNLHLGENKEVTFKYIRDSVTNIRNLIINKAGEQYKIIEYPLIIIFILSGGILLMSSADLVSIFLCIELQSYGLYILCTLYRDSESSTASGLTYFLLGGLSSCFILLGSAILYANSGTTNLDNIYIISNISQITRMTPDLFASSASAIGEIGWYQPSYLHLSLIIMSVGFLFKVSAAPFHFWSPDVYDGIPTIVTTFVAIIAKISIFAFLLELVYYTEFYFIGTEGSDEVTSSLQTQGGWKNVLLISSLLSLIVGSVLGLTQGRIKRLFAYSTISHVGFILLALSINSIESVQAYIFYILQYSLSNLNAFIILITIGYTLYLYMYKEKQESNLDIMERNISSSGGKQQESQSKRQLEMDKINSPIQLISQLKGYFYINPAIAISLSITLFSFVGVPPLVGFFAKQMVLSAALDGGYVFMALVAILTSVIGAAYYLNVINQIFFYKSDYEAYSNVKSDTSIDAILSTQSGTSKLLSTDAITENIKNNIVITSSLSSAIAIITLILITFIFSPSEWLNISGILSLILFKS